MDTQDNVNPTDTQGVQPIDNTQDTKVTPPAEPQASRPEWLKSNFKTADDQAKAYHEAEKLMTKSAQEAARLREEVAILRSQVNPPAGVQNTPPQSNFGGMSGTNSVQEIPYNVRAMIEQRYPGASPETIVAMYDVFNAQFQPIRETIYGSQVETAKEKFAKDNPLFDRFRPEMDAVLNRYPIEERSKPNTIQTVYSWVVNQHLPELQKEWFEQGRNETLVKPVVPSFTGDTGTVAPAPAMNSGSIKLTPAQVAMGQKLGLTEAEIIKTLTSREGK